MGFSCAVVPVSIRQSVPISVPFSPPWTRVPILVNCFDHAAASDGNLVCDDVGATNNCCSTTASVLITYHLFR